MEEKIRSATQEALKALGAGDVSFAVEWPTDPSHGDFSVNAGLAGAKKLGKNPRELAGMLAEHMRETLGADASKIEVAGAGFINIHLSREVIAKEILRAGSEGEVWGRSRDNEGKRISVEYSCPNPFKEMHIGHLMSTIIGESVSRIIENSGATVIRDTYGGDVGPHVAKALWALRRDGVTDVAHASEVDKAYLQGARAYEESETAKAEIEVLNQDIYKAENKELMELWRKCREVCLESFRELYKVLGTTFDYYFFESEVTPIGMEVVQDGVAKGVFNESEGAIIYDGEKDGLHTLVFITSRGTPTYEAKEIGLAFYKEERIQSDEVIIETGAEQIGHFKVFLSALSHIAPLIAKKMSHLSHGLMVDTEGKKLSSRLGNAVTATELVASVIARAKEKNDDPVIAQQVAVGAIKYMILRQAPGGNIIFDAEKSLSLEGDSGPYLQYALVRARKILAYATDSAGAEIPEAPYAIERTILHFPYIVAHAARERAPQHITHYLTALAGEWNSFYASEQVLGSAEEAYKQKVARAFALTMENGLRLLGIPAPERM
jgi:arginyl-tRNA synthetase